MAINNQDKALTVARELQAVTEAIMGGVERYAELLAQVNATGLNFADYNAQYAEQPGLRHIDGDVINAVLTQLAAIKAYLDTGYNKDPLNKFRTGA